MLGERGLWYKMNWFEGSARVPFIVHAPNRFTPKRIKENVSTMDILPTFAGMVGAPLEPSLPLDGVSLLPYLTGGEGIKTDTVFGEYMAEGSQSPVIMIRRGKWKFIYSLIDPPMLFDLEADPLEQTNLAAFHSPAVLAAAAAPCQPREEESKLKIKTGLPTPPDGEAPGAVSFVSTEKSFFPRIPADVVSTPPRTPSPALLPLALPRQDDPNAILEHFIQEVHARWNLQALHEDVVRSQRRRRLVYEPRVDSSKQYVRNQGKGILDDVEYLSRWPRVPIPPPTTTISEA